MKKIGFFYLFILFISCEKNEIPVAKHTMGEILVQQINMSSDYSKQIFYSTSENIIVSSNTKDTWDLAFRSSENSSEIIINSSTFSQICELEDHPFEDMISTTNLLWKWDNPQGIYTETALGIPKKTTTFVLDRGYNIDGTSRGYKKIKIDSINNNSYIITYANLDNSETQNVSITKDSLFNYKYFSFTSNNIVNIEPKKNSWDLAFTQYTHLFINDTETPAYLVTGVLTNYLNNVMIAKDTINAFDSITIEMIESYVFSQHQDAIGYNWKYYSFESQSYTVLSDINYIIKDISGRYFKMHFIDFYNDVGEKGYPKFEIQEL